MPSSTKSTLQSSLENAEADVYNSQAELDYQKSNFETNENGFSTRVCCQKANTIWQNTITKKAKAALKSAQANFESSGAKI